MQIASMHHVASHRALAAQDLEALLDVTRALAQPFDLAAMLAEVIRTARQILAAERCSVWLHHPATSMLVLEVASGIGAVRIPLGVGIAGACAQTRTLINVPDCQSDPRFDCRIDKASGYRTRCMLTLPLIDHADRLVGVLQVLNKHDGVFDETDERLSMALAAQCAIALQRVQMTEALLEAGRMRQELEMARVVQMSALPSAMPVVAGYDMFAMSRPAEQTGGDTFDLELRGDRLLILLGDATGHGIAPALSVTQMQAMLRMAFRLGASLETAFVEVNNLLGEGLPDDRFITAFIGMLDTTTHALRFISGGQGPILHYHAADASFSQHRPTSFPLGAMPLARPKPAMTLALLPGDFLVLLSDGIYEYRNASDAEFGEAGVKAVVRAHRAKSPAAVTQALLEAVQRFAAGAPQEDDMTILLVKRDPLPPGLPDLPDLPGAIPAPLSRGFTRRIDSLAQVLAFTSEVFAAQGIDATLRTPVDFILEELFTNMVKYSAASLADIRIDIGALGRGVEVTLRDFDVERFDVAAPSPVDPCLPIEQRTPGGLGVYLVQRLADLIDYEYIPATRESRITFHKFPDSPAESAQR